WEAVQPSIEETLAAAATAHQDARVAGLIADLQWCISHTGRAGEALALEPVAVAALRRAGNAPAARAMVLHSYGAALGRAGRYAGAERVVRDAIAAQEPLGGPMQQTLHQKLGQILIDQARYDEARTELGRVMELVAAGLGPRHPRMIPPLI